MRFHAGTAIAASWLCLFSACSEDGGKPLSRCPSRGRLVSADSGDPASCAVVVHCKGDRTFTLKCATAGAEDAGVGSSIECACMDGEKETKTVSYRAVYCAGSAEGGEVEAKERAVSVMAEACDFDIEDR